MQRRDFLRGPAAAFAGLAVPLCADSAEEVRPHRWIGEMLCSGCGQCVPLCPVGAIKSGELGRPCVGGTVNVDRAEEVFARLVK